MMNGGKTMLQLGLLVAAMFVLQTILSVISPRHSLRCAGAARSPVGAGQAAFMRA